MAKFGKWVSVATLVSAVGCADMHDAELSERPAEISVVGVKRIAQLEPEAPFCRTLFGSYSKPYGVSICHTLYREPNRAYHCDTDDVLRETKCENDVVIQHEYDGSFTVFVGDSYDATLTPYAKLHTSIPAMEIRFDDGTNGTCEIENDSVTLCVRADPKRR